MARYRYERRNSASELLGAPRTTVLRPLVEPLPTVELARRLGVTPSAVSRHLRLQHATGPGHPGP
ncbi:ArsR family transcriptional regulator [Streptomyces viridochromogenes]|uniref:Putative Regulator protein n=1 Tax=Streptomyces viridochromogenes Tue57 TaxID=1160705 RepID=L8PR43_STRVR|nr:ArsR family transcriptional regulator [Streptomyces viridochromogenes]ELS58488.1 putative Regulator protein [Streptomyces viridochromogenes Tue57]